MPNTRPSGLRDLEPDEIVNARNTDKHDLWLYLDGYWYPEPTLVMGRYQVHRAVDARQLADESDRCSDQVHVVIFERSGGGLVEIPNYHGVRQGYEGLAVIAIGVVPPAGAKVCPAQ